MSDYTVKVEDDLLDALLLFSEAAETVGASWLVVGATARIMLLEQIYGLPAGRATRDIDFGVLVGDWEQYRSLCELIVNKGVNTTERKPAKRFITSGDRIFDLAPYGGVEDEQGRVFWPPEQDDVMTVRGFNSAAQSSITVKVNDSVDVPVISPQGLCALKLFAWQERHHQQPGKDAEDIAYLVRHIEALYPPAKLFEVHPDTVEAADYVIPQAGIMQLGADMASMLTEEERQFLSTLLHAELAQQGDSQLCRELSKHPGDNIQASLDTLNCLYRGLEKVL